MPKDFIQAQDLALFTSGSRFTLASLFLKEGMQHAWATFDLFVRELPEHRNYLVFAGLEHVINYLLRLRFDTTQLSWIKKQFHFSAQEMKYFEQFRFSGDVWAMPEGSIFFPHEPVIRVSAPMIEAQFIEMFLINTVYLQTILASKLSRFVHATNGKETYLGFNRCYGIDAAMKATRVGEIVGIGKQSLALYAFKNPHVSLMSRGTFHYLFQCYDSEFAAMEAYMRHAPSEGSILIDTYQSQRGLKCFISAARQLLAQGKAVNRIMLDSGDLLHESRYVRQRLNKAGLSSVKIVGMGNLDEYKVARLEKEHAPLDAYAGVTELLTPSDAPTLELVYKLSEMKKDGLTTPTMKTSTKKVSLPGRKQVYRRMNREQYVGDSIGLEGEEQLGKPLLQNVMKNGELSRNMPTVQQIARHYNTEQNKFDGRIFSVERRHVYPVSISTKLTALKERIKKSLYHR